MAELVIDARKIVENARALRGLCASRGATLLPVVKSFAFFSPLIDVLRAEGFERLGWAGPAPVAPAREAAGQSVMIALPAPARAEAVVRQFGVSHNTEPVTIGRLSQAAAKTGRRHGLIVMLEVGDLREGVLPEHVLALTDLILALERREGAVRFQGLAVNFGCLSGLMPQPRAFDLLESVVGLVRRRVGDRDMTVSLGGSVILPWFETGELPEAANEARLGYSLILGRVPGALGDETRPYLTEGAVTLEGVVLEIKEKPSVPWGECGRDAFGRIKRFVDLGVRRRAVLDFGLHDTDPEGVDCLLPGVRLVGANSNCSVFDVSDCPASLRPGDSLRFVVRSYAALTRGFHSLSLVKSLLPSADAASGTCPADAAAQAAE